MKRNVKRVIWKKNYLNSNSFIRHTDNLHILTATTSLGGAAKENAEATASSGRTTLPMAMAMPSPTRATLSGMAIESAATEVPTIVIHRRQKGTTPAAAAMAQQSPRKK